MVVLAANIDCEDCRREKKENDALIAIYERVQAADHRAKTMRKSVDFHQSVWSETRTKFGDLDTRISNLPKQSKAETELKHMGVETAL